MAGTLAGALHGPLHGSWKGDDAGYAGIHKRARARLPRVCVHCGATRNLEAALIHGRATKFSRQGRRYSTDTNDYVRLCKSCHRKYDGNVGNTQFRKKEA